MPLKPYMALGNGCHEILGHRANHFETLLNHANPVDANIQDQLQELHAPLNTPPQHSCQHAKPLKA